MCYDETLRKILFFKNLLKDFHIKVVTAST